MSNRRQFVHQASVFGLTAGLLPGIPSTSDVNATSVPNTTEPEITGEVDVLVVGCTAGYHPLGNTHQKNSRPTPQPRCNHSRRCTVIPQPEVPCSRVHSLKRMNT